MKLRTCVAPRGEFVFGAHHPEYVVDNFRDSEDRMTLGRLPDGKPLENNANFPTGPVNVSDAQTVFEIPNPFPFRGTTYILKTWADAKARAPETIGLPSAPGVSLSQSTAAWFSNVENTAEKRAAVFETLPHPLQLALAATSTDPEDLMQLARLCCEFVRDPKTRRPVGLHYQVQADGSMGPVIRDPVLFDVLANNYHLPDDFKDVMVLRPGAQGHSEIVGESRNRAAGSHVWEYLRRNSYIPWGHYAANMGQDAVRYRLEDLTLADMTGMRHLYYQRIYTAMARDLDMALPGNRRPLSAEELEDLRHRVRSRLFNPKHPGPAFNSTLWGWNFGFDYAPSQYRLHASHQQIHQQFALLPSHVPTGDASRRTENIPAYACGDQIHGFTQAYYAETGRRFFDAYIAAIRANQRMDGLETREKSLIIHEDAHCMVFVPKAQTSQWELQLMSLEPVGNILEANRETRDALDRAMLVAVKTLSALGSRMITTFEYSKRFDEPDTDQRLLYSFLPRLPESPGAFSEAQLRWINGHYPEDFAAACRARVPTV